MTKPCYSSSLKWRSLLLLGLVVSAPGVWISAQRIREASLRRQTADSLPPSEFSRLVLELSEEDGYFRSDNFTSNETSYLHVSGELRKMRGSGGAYIGVGPEQNFTYIAKVRPWIAFVVDIRRQALIQHLMYKAVFAISENRAEFLSNLLARPLRGKNAPRGGASLDQLVNYFDGAPYSDAAYAANLSCIREMITGQFRIPLSEGDLDRLQYISSAFGSEGLEISFRFGRLGRWPGYGGFPCLRDLILERDLEGKPGNFLVSEEDYQFVRDLHVRNRIIPVTGDFAGGKALRGVGDYLRRNGLSVRAFYTSNVEWYLFRNRVFAAFVENLRKLPLDGESVIIRAVAGRGQPHPARIPGHRTTTILQKISVLLSDYEQGTYADYYDLVTTHYIAGRKP